MNVGVHQHPCIAEKAGLLDPILQAQKEIIPIPVIKKQLQIVDGPHHDVMGETGLVDARFAGHIRTNNIIFDTVPKYMIDKNIPERLFYFLKAS
jgi:hypothetical protein